MGIDEMSDVGHGGDVFKEAAVRTGHIGTHFLDEAVAWWLSWYFFFLRGRLLGFFTGGTVFDSKNYIEELNERALCVTSSAVLSVLCFPVSGVV